MNFEIKHDNEHLPDEEDIYDVNDAEERDEFNSLFGLTPLEKKVHQRKIVMRIVAVLVIIIVFGIALALGMLDAVKSFLSR